MMYYCRKAGGLLVTLALVSLITFGVFQILPGNPAYIILGVDADPMQIEALEQSMGLDKPLYQRYFSWIRGLFAGDLGTSFRYQQPVSQLITSGLTVTGSLAVMTMLMTVLIGIPAGIWLAGHGGRKYSVGFSMLSQISLSVPAFCMGIFLINLFSVRLKWLPSIGYISWAEDPAGCMRSLLLPSLSIALGSSAVLIRYVKDRLQQGPSEIKGDVPARGAQFPDSGHHDPWHADRRYPGWQHHHGECVLTSRHRPPDLCFHLQPRPAAFAGAGALPGGYRRAV